MNLQGMTSFVLIPQEELSALKTTQLEILEGIKNIQSQAPTLITAGYVTALEFMAAVKIRRSKFDQLVTANNIRTVKKKRKIYVPVTEIERYFKDPTIQ